MGSRWQFVVALVLGSAALALGELALGEARIAAAVLHAAFMYRRELTLSPGGRLALATCRVTAISLLPAMLFRPVLTARYTTQTPRSVVVLLDSSASMSLRDTRKAADALEQDQREQVYNAQRQALQQLPDLPAASDPGLAQQLQSIGQCQRKLHASISTARILPARGCSCWVADIS